jgi:hypothetical protein
VAIAIASGGDGVDGKDLVPACHQALDQQAAVGFDADDHFRCVGSPATNERLDIREPVEATSKLPGPPRMWMW